MRKWRTQVVTSLAILLACCAGAFALDPSRDITQYAHTAWRDRHGFAKGFVYSIAQTPDGYLWLGTEFGLLRFDGVRAVPWQPPGQQLPGEAIWSLLVTGDGTLWIGTDKGLVSWKHAKLTPYSELTGQAITSLLEDREGAVWVGTAAYPSSGKLCEIRTSVICHGGDGTFGGSVFGLFEDSRGTLWLGVGGGFWRWKPGLSEFFAVPGQRDVIQSFAEDEESTLLVGTEVGIQRFVGGRLEPYQLTHFPEGFHPKQMLRDREGSLWIATYNAGLVHVHSGRAESLSESDGLSGNVGQALLEDREGNIWAATLSGLDRFRNYAIPNISIKQGLSSANTLSVLAANDQTLWIATNKGLDRWKDGRISRPDSGGRTDNKLQRPAHTLFQDHSGRVYFSSSVEFGYEFGYLANNHFIPIRDFPQEGWVHSAAELGAGQLWVANQATGLLHMVDGKIVQAVPWAGMGHNDYALAVVADPSKKALWLGFSSGGVAYLEDGAIRASYSERDGLGAGIVHALRFGPRGELWASTQGGLSRIKDGQVRTLTTKNGLPCDKVHWSMEDDDHSMWLYMSCGLVRIARSEMDSWVADPFKHVHTTLFDVSDGVRSHSFSPPVQSVTKSADGKIWFVAFDGVSVIDPHNLHENKLPPPVHIENITADDKPVEISNGMHLPTSVRHLDIDYTALSLVVPEKVRFRIKLEGEDKDWRELVNVRHVEYTNLPPKHYRFRVLASNNSGVWNEEGATLDFVIPPMWYQTNWFRAACVAVFFAMLWGIYELRVRQLAHQFNMRLEERVAERTRIARDLHDTLLQSFQALLPLLQAGINMFGSRPADALRTFEKAADHASQAIAEGRDAIQGMRMSTVEKNDLAVAIRALGEELASAAKPSSPNFTVVVEGASRNLHPILRDEVYRLTTEALRNAFRHAAAQNVEVEIRYDEKYFRLRIRDDGKGIPSDVLSGDGREGHYGLPGMRERAKLIGGKLTIWTELDGGTEIELNIPGARAYVKSARPFWYFGKRSAAETDQKEPIERE